MANIKEVWKFGIQDAKNFKVWHWSQEFESFDKAYDAYRDWIKTDRGRHNFKVIPRTIYLPTTDSKA